MATPTTAAPTQQTAERPTLSVVKDAPAPLEGTVVEHQGTSVRPAWIESSAARVEAVKRHAVDNRMYLPWAARGYRQLGRRWLDARRDDYPQLIRSARSALKAADGDVADESKLKQLVHTRRAEYGWHKLIHTGKTAAWSAVAGVGGTVGLAAGGLWVDLFMSLATVATGAWHGRPGASLGNASPSGGQQELGAPAPAIDDETLQKAVNDAGFPGRINILAPTTWADDGTSTTVFDMPPGATVAALQRKIEALAAALGRDVSMVDVTKAGAAGRASLWMTDIDPFATPRRSPLLAMTGGIDAFKDGVPVAWNKRSTAIVLPVNNSSFVIAGMTRSGKGVGAANLAAGSAMDVRINLRIVAGKSNGEWDAYAKEGVAATYFKPNAARLLSLLEALIADMNRRNKELGKLGKSKMTAETITRLGGLELLIIDELATYTRQGCQLRDEILKALTDLSAVAAGAGILLVLITQYPEVDVIPQALAMNCGTRWAMRVDNATQSNAILGGGQSSNGRDASKFDPPLPGLGWLVNPFAAVTDKARSFDLDEDERGEITELMQRAAALRSSAGRLVGQWDDPIEKHLLNATGLSSAAGGLKRDGVPGRHLLNHTPEQRHQIACCRESLAAMDKLGRDVAQLDEMAQIIGAIAGDELGEALRAAGAGGTVKVTIEGRGRVNGYRREDVEDALKFLTGA